MSWREFIEDDAGRGSASRLNMMIGVLVGSFAVVFLTIKDHLGGEIFATYLLATGGVYVFGKARESVVEIEQIKADSPNSPIALVAPLAPLGPTTTINVGTNKEDANINAQGDVNMKAKRK